MRERPLEVRLADRGRSRWLRRLAETHREAGRAYYLNGCFHDACESWRRGAEVNRYDPWGERCQEAVGWAGRGTPVPVD